MQSIILSLLGFIFGSLGAGLLTYSFSGNCLMTLGAALLGGLLAGWAGYAIPKPISRL